MKKVMLLLAAAMLVLGATAAWAMPTINIVEPIDETLPPTVESSGFTIPRVVFTAPEFANITGALTGATATNFITSAVYGIKMLEPAFEGGGVSDFAILGISPRIPVVNTQAFNLTFLSDGFGGTIPPVIPIIGGLTTFDAALAAFDVAAAHGLLIEFPSILENGTLQNLFTFTAASGLIVNAQSDVVPLPASVLLFGTGLLGLVPVWRLRRKA
jgi:hypothetical protein